MILASTIVVLSLLGAAPNDPSAFDWPQWRGPNRDGISKEVGLLKSWPKAGPHADWKVSGLGIGYSTPTVAAGRIYGMGDKSGDEYVWCLNEKDGKEIWSQKIAKTAKVTSNGEGGRSTPTIDGDRLFCVGVGGEFVCLSTKDGTPLWKKNYNFISDFGGSKPAWGYAESPLVDGDLVICTPGSDKAAIVAFNKMTGEVVWKSEIKSSKGNGYCSIVKATLGKTKMYITMLGKDGGVVAVNAQDGKLLWSYNGITNAVANITTVVVHNDMVLASTAYGGGTALLKMKESASGVTVEEVEKNKLQNHHGGMILLGDYVYFGAGQNDCIPTCLDFKTGKMVWQGDRPMGVKGSAAMSSADGLLYVRYQSGLIALVEPSPKEFKVISSFIPSELSGKSCWPHPVIANGKLYIRDQDKLTCYNLKAK